MSRKRRRRRRKEHIERKKRKTSKARPSNRQKKTKEILFNTLNSNKHFGPLNIVCQLDFDYDL